MRTTARLTALAEMLPNVDAIADVGSDHGLLCAYMLTIGKCKKAIAVDISTSAVEKASLLARSLGIEDSLIPRLGDGLLSISPGEVGAAAIAGMGGRLIVSIINSSPKVSQRIPLVLQPMQQIGELRRFLKANGFAVTEERMVKENGRIFEMMTVEQGQYKQAADIPKELEDEIGSFLWERGDPLLCESLRRSAKAFKRAASEARAPDEIVRGLEEKSEAYFSAAVVAEAKGRHHVHN